MTVFDSGYRVVIMSDPMMWERVRRHKKRRTDKKWRKRYGFRQVIDRKQLGTMLLVEGCTWYIYRSDYPAFMAQLQKINEEQGNYAAIRGGGLPLGARMGDFYGTP